MRHDLDKEHGWVDRLAWLMHNNNNTTCRRRGPSKPRTQQYDLDIWTYPF